MFLIRREDWQMANTEQLLYQTDKSSHQRLPIKKSQVVRPANLLKKTPIQMLSCEYCKICKSTYFEEHMAASEKTLGSDCLGISFWGVTFKTILT